MPRLLYFDDLNEGISRQKSHPRFIELASADFYYDCTDDFSPFGNDDGHDVLFSLEDWYRDGGLDTKIVQFLNHLLADWDLGVPKDLLLTNPEAIESWLSEDRMNETFLLSECRARLATAFGQLKITGEVDPRIVIEGLDSISCQLYMNERARRIYPDWKYADDNYQRLVQMQEVLKSL
jgi:uncharacterized protein YfeS